MRPRAGLRSMRARMSAEPYPKEPADRKSKNHGPGIPPGKLVRRDVTENRDAAAGGAAFDAREDVGRTVSEGAGQHQAPVRFEGLERFHQARDVLTLLDGAYVQDDLFAGGWGIGKVADAVVDDADFGGFHAEQ